MSINFNDPMNDKARSVIHELFGEPAAEDDRHALFDKIGTIRQQDMKRIANAAKQAATLEIHDKGDIKVMSDGTRYIVTHDGWRKL